MNINNISFGAKIPVATCQIYNKSIKQPCKATIYEFDCKDEHDEQYFRKIPGRWTYSKDIANDIDMRRCYPRQFSNYRFFALETQDNKPVGIMEYITSDDANNVDFIEAHQRNKYKYIGTTLLAHAAKQTLKENLEELIICDPVEKAIPFYTDKCGFRDGIGSPELRMKQEGMKKLIEHAKEKTKAPIIDINA